MPTRPANIYAPPATFMNGWANDPQIEAEIGAWFDPTSVEEER
jgi:hypothetical protein